MKVVMGEHPSRTTLVFLAVTAAALQLSVAIGGAALLILLVIAGASL